MNFFKRILLQICNNQDLWFLFLFLFRNMVIEIKFIDSFLFKRNKETKKKKKKKEKRKKKKAQRANQTLSTHTKLEKSRKSVGKQGEVGCGV